MIGTMLIGLVVSFFNLILDKWFVPWEYGLLPLFVLGVILMGIAGRGGESFNLPL
jgi:hypothetical protein